MRKTSSKVVIVFTTVPKRSNAVNLSQALVKKRLAACATVLPAVRSFYRWERKIVQGKEALIMLKTTRQRYSALEKAIKALHSYEVPEIIAVQVENGYLPYLGWVSNEVDN